MKLQEYIKMNKGEQNGMNVGDRFRPLESKDDGIKVGSTVFFYEVIRINSAGYEVLFAYDKITEGEMCDPKITGL